MGVFKLIGTARGWSFVKQGLQNEWERNAGVLKNNCINARG